MGRIEEVGFIIIGFIVIMAFSAYLAATFNGEDRYV